MEHYLYILYKASPIHILPRLRQCSSIILTRIHHLKHDPASDLCLKRHINTPILTPQTNTLIYLNKKKPPPTPKTIMQQTYLPTSHLLSQKWTKYFIQEEKTIQHSPKLATMEI